MLSAELCMRISRHIVSLLVVMCLVMIRPGCCIDIFLSVLIINCYHITVLKNRGYEILANYHIHELIKKSNKLSMKIILKNLFKWISRLSFYIQHPFSNVKLGNKVFIYKVKISSGGVYVSIGDRCSVRHLVVKNQGKNNKVIIHRGCRLNKLTCWMEGDNNIIEIGEHTSIHGKTQLAACDGHNITIGNNCLFSHDIYMRTTDSHSIIDSEGNRINYEEDITIGNHVWIGMQSLVLKGAIVPDDCIVGARSTVTKQTIEPNSLIVGTPAKTIKNDIKWITKRI